MKKFDESKWRRANIPQDTNNVWVARNGFEDGTFKVKWNDEWRCWALKSDRDTLVLVKEIYDEN